MQNKLIEHIGAGRQVLFDKFMQYALYAPQIGYYMNSKPKFGPEGDFVTAPNISCVFGQSIARTIAPLINQHPTIVEFGAGNGQLMYDLLCTLEQINALPEQVYIIELSASLKAIQQQKLARFNVVWLSALPANLNAIVIANEVLDALPVKRFRYSNGLKEIAVKIEPDFPEIEIEPSNELTAAIAQLNIDFAPGYASEICPLLQPWIGAIDNMLSAGLVLLFDYGFDRATYYHPDRTMGTFIGHYKHRSIHEPLKLAPNVDLTAHVDFTAVAEARGDMDVLAYTSQAHFMLENLQLITQLSKEQQIAATQLINPTEMGELFKLIILGKKTKADFNYKFLGL